MGTDRQPSERDLYWLDHAKKVSNSGMTAKAYAAENDLSLHSLYQSQKRLRKMGLLPPGQRRRLRSSEPSSASSFSKVEVSRLPARPLDFRLSLPNGVVLEWSGGELPVPILALVERLTPPR